MILAEDMPGVPAPSPGAEFRGRITWHVAALTLIAVTTLFSRFLRHSFYGLFEDDFYYYALVAKHLALSHQSTFDGSHLTNGYHPLWMLVVVACAWLSSGTGFFIAVQAFALLAIIAYYFGVLRVLTAFAISPRLLPLAALVASLHALLLLRYGMEVTLALPLGVWTVAYLLSPSFRWSPRQAVTCGLLASLTVLARLDAILLITLLVIAEAVSCRIPWRQRLSRLGLFASGWILFLIYLASNVTYFHALLPVSGQAKQLKPLWPISAIPLIGFFLPLDRTKLICVYPALIVIAAAVFAFLRKAQSAPTRRHHAIQVALLLSPVLHIAALCLLSDWTIWPWYYYSLCFALLAAFTILLSPRTDPAANPSRPAHIFLLSAVVVLSLYLGAYSIFRRPARPLLLQVPQFVDSHPGIYAMGDGSGLPAYLSSSPFIQLEGLTMDAEYIERIRQRQPLRNVLRQYHADYFVSLRNPAQSGCQPLREPAQAGPHSPALRGTVCAAPLALYTGDGVEVAIYKASDILLP